jgi:citrate lyase subunit beta / citryl-CoA lyase
MIRSYLFVPGDSERKLAKATQSGADALILDLEDSVTIERKHEARAIVQRFLADARAADQPGPRLFVRINALPTGLVPADLAAIMRGAPAGVVLPKCEGYADIAAVDNQLSALEAREGLTPGSTRIITVASETARAVMNLATSGSLAHPRLLGMMWGAEDLAADIGALANRDERGVPLAPFALARDLCLIAAAAARVEPIDTVYTAIDDLDGLAAECTAARRVGFIGKAAIHPGQVATINRLFSPSEAEIEWSRRVVAAFRDSGGANVLRLDGRMLDQPHLRQAERILAAAERLEKQP